MRIFLIAGLGFASLAIFAVLAKGLVGTLLDCAGHAATSIISSTTRLSAPSCSLLIIINGRGATQKRGLVTSSSLWGVGYSLVHVRSVTALSKATMALCRCPPVLYVALWHVCTPSLLPSNCCARSFVGSCRERDMHASMRA